MKINILLPYKEKFDKYKASSVSLTVKNNFKYSKYQKNIIIYGQETDNPILENNFIGIKKPFLFFKSKNNHLAKSMCKIILSYKDKKQIIEIHNRPYLIKIICKYVENYPISLFYHNDPQTMAGSKTIKERKGLLKKLTAIFCVSQHIKNKFLEGLDVNSKNSAKVFVIHNGVNRILKHFPSKNKEVIFSGRLVPEKGVHLYVGALSKIAKQYPDWKFRLIGSTYLGSSNKESSFALQTIQNFKKIGDQAIFEGFLSSEQLQKKMEVASIIVIPSIWDEPFGLVVAEAMSNGIAIITSNVGGIPEIIKQNGILINNISEVKVENELLKLLNKTTELERYQKLSWENFSHTSFASSYRLDFFRKKIMFKKM